MKKKFTFLSATLLLLTLIGLPTKMMGQTTVSYGWETADDATKWTITDAIVATSDQGNTGTYAGKINTNHTYVQFKEKVYVTSFSFAFKRTSNNSNYNVYIETSTDGETWTAVETYTMGSFSNGSYTTKTHTFDGTTEYYVRFHCYNTTAVRYVDDVQITYNTSAVNVATPTFSVEEGAYEEAQSVEISCTTTGASIYYTTNGDTPTNQSTLYDGNAISITETTTLKAIAYVGNDASSVASATYTILDPNRPGTQNNPYTVAEARAAINANTDVTGVYATGIVSAIVTAYDSQYSNITFDFVDSEGDTNSLRAYRCGGDDAAEVRVGDEVVVTGNLIKYGDIYEFAQGCTLVSLTHSVTPLITADNVEIAYDANSGKIDYTIENAVQGVTLSATTNAEWISDLTVGETSVTFTTTANDGDEDRTASVTLSYEGAADKVVTVTQGHYVIDYVELPFEWEGGIKADLLEWAGVTGEGLGDDYGDSHAPYQIKFDNDDDYILIKTDSQPGKVTIGVKMVGGGNTSVITVQGSADGEDFIDVEEFTISGRQNDILTLETTKAFASTDRYVRLLFGKGSNVGVGPITIEAVDYTPSITVNPDMIEVSYEGESGNLDLTYANLEINKSADFGVQFYDAEGEELDDDAKPNWISAEVASGDNGYVVAYEIDDNEGDVRTAYFKVFALGDEDYVYSNLVTVSQQAAILEYTLTVSSLENVEMSVYTGEDSEFLFEGEDYDNVYEGTEVMLFVEANEGYVLQSLMVNDEEHVNDIDDGVFLFNMPAYDVTITATAVEYVAPATVTYSLASSIVSGKHYIIVGEKDGSYYAMGEQKSNNRDAVEIPVEDGVASVSSDQGVHEFVIRGTDASGHYTIYDEKENSKGYLYAASGSSNHLKTQSNINSNALWTIELNSETGAASIKADGSSNRNVMQYNSGSNLFACYASASQSPVYLYVRDNDDSPETYTIAMNADGLMTYCGDKALDFTNTGIKAYKASVSGTAITLTGIDEVPAGTGVLLRKVGDESIVNVPVATTASAIEDNALVGVTTEIPTLAGTTDGYANYILGKNSAGVVAFYRANDNKVAAGKAYLSVPVTSGVREIIGLNFDDATGIETIENSAVSQFDNCFDLQGRRVAQPTRGLYIVNGKKVVLK